MSKKVVLGINYGSHDTSAAILVDGELVAACEEERYTGNKHTREFPINAINDCLKLSNTTFSDISCVAFGYEPDILLKNESEAKKIRRELKSKEIYKNILKKNFNYEGRVDFHEHHLCHLASAYYPSGFSKSLLMSNDGIGETLCSMFGSGENGKIKKLVEKNHFPNSLGLIYAAVTFYLGWRPNYDEGIVMGLAPLGDSSKTIEGTNHTYLEIFRDIIQTTGDYEIEINKQWISYHKVRNKFVSDKFIKTFGPKKEWSDKITENHKNIAAGLQDRLEEVVLSQLKNARREFGYSRLCIAGGVGLNCSLNGKISQSGIFDEIFVQPGSGDNGLAIGAAYLSHENMTKNYVPKKMHNFYLGSEQKPADIRKYLEEQSYPYEEIDVNYHSVVDQLVAGKIIAWHQGRAEFGPRALGNRSILTAPFPATMKDYINERVKFREEFRPFAPAIIDSEADNYFHISQESPHMLMAVKVKEEAKSKIPAVIHVDNSARVQTVSKDNNDKFFKLLNEFEKRTGCPVLLNTSFNVKGQPIINDVQQAIKCFLSTNIDVLVVDKFMLKKESFR